MLETDDGLSDLINCDFENIMETKDVFSEYESLLKID